MVMLATEKRDLLEPEPRAWIKLPAPMQYQIEPWAPDQAEAIFLAAWRHYGNV